MDANLKKILDELPSKPPRSRLAPYREFIEELRSRGRTYRDIAEILAEKCRVQVTASGVHHFMRIRSGSGGSLAKSGRKLKSLPSARPSDCDNLVPAPASEETQRKIAALKARAAAAKPNSSAFAYDPDQPLRLKKSIPK